LLCGVDEALFQLRWAHWKQRQGRWLLAKNLLPKASWGIQQDRAVLQQMTLPPELGAADALASFGMHQIGGCADGKTVAAL
jgi:hypothetical protein